MGTVAKTQQPGVLGTAVGNPHVRPGMGKVHKVTRHESCCGVFCFAMLDRILATIGKGRERHPPPHVSGGCPLVKLTYQWRGSCGRWPAPNSHAPRFARDFARVGRSISFGDGSHHRNRPALGALLGGWARAALLAHHRRLPALLALLESQDAQDLTLSGLVVNLGLLGNRRLVRRATVTGEVVLAEGIDLEKLLIGKVARRPILRRIPTTERRPPGPWWEGTASLGSLGREGAGSDVDGDGRGDSRRRGAVGREEAAGRGARRAVWAVGRAVHCDWVCCVSKRVKWLYV